MSNLLKSIQFATKAHLGQTRKGKDIPYITHPLGVGILLASIGAKEDVIIAGILHDTIEDCNVKFEDIEREFNLNVAEMVNDVTEQDTTLPWDERKKIALEHVSVMNPNSVLIKSADVLYNMNDMLEDYKVEGDKMFIHFKAPKEKQLERYQKLMIALKERNLNNPLIPQLEDTLKQLTKLWE